MGTLSLSLSLSWFLVQKRRGHVDTASFSPMFRKIVCMVMCVNSKLLIDKKRESSNTNFKRRGTHLGSIQAATKGHAYHTSLARVEPTTWGLQHNHSTSWANATTLPYEVGCVSVCNFKVARVEPTTRGLQRNHSTSWAHATTPPYEVGCVSVCNFKVQVQIQRKKRTLKKKKLKLFF